MTQVRASQRLAVRQCPIDARTVKISAAQHLGEQAHLPAGAAPLTLDPPGRQSGFSAHSGHEIIVQGVNFIGNGVQEERPLVRAQIAQYRQCRRGGVTSRIHFGFGGLVKAARQRLAGGCIDTAQLYAAPGTASAADVVVSK